MIHKYKLNGYNICLDVHSGAVHVLDDVAYDILDYCDENMSEQPCPKMLEELSAKYDKEELIETYEALYELYQEGQLFSADDYEQFADLMTKAPIKSMCINISHDCNLRCEYCFAAKGDFGQGRCLMPLETAKKAIDFIIANSGTRRNLEVDFFGGEPLMNFNVVKQTVAYARSIEKQHNKNFRFTLTTNGLLLDDEKIAYLNQEMSNVVLSLDGRKEVNDRLRVTPNGKGCYDVIVPLYQKLVAQRNSDKDYYVRGTFTKYNLDF
ncbi:MAG: radical SAM protein, partial [Clostridia bacterium]|nr:radical SAM protein [Clostridia bacterium]